MDLFEKPLAVTLTVADWLEVQCALSDAWTHNNEAAFPFIARGIIGLKRRIAAQSQGDIDAAAAAVATEVAA